MTRAKMTCISVKKYQGWGSGSTPPPMFFEAEFVPVTGTSEENKSFFASTPSGSLKLSTIREDHFIPGKSYYVDFTEAE